MKRVLTGAGVIVDVLRGDDGWNEAEGEVEPGMMFAHALVRYPSRVRCSPAFPIPLKLVLTSPARSKSLMTPTIAFLNAFNPSWPAIKVVTAVMAS